MNAYFTSDALFKNTDICNVLFYKSPWAKTWWNWHFSLIPLEADKKARLQCYLSLYLGSKLQK